MTSLELYGDTLLKPYLISDNYRVLGMLPMGLSGALSELTGNNFSISQFPDV